jgi:hypothetical protein
VRRRGGAAPELVEALVVDIAGGMDEPDAD